MGYAELARLLRERGEVGTGCSDAELQEVAAFFSHGLPAPYIAFLRDFGWAAVGSQELNGYGREVPKHLNVLEITRWERDEAYPPLAPHLVPLANTGGGDLHCLDLSSDGAPVVYRAHDDAAPHGTVEATDLCSWALAYLAGG